MEISNLLNSHCSLFLNSRSNDEFLIEDSWVMKKDFDNDFSLFYVNENEEIDLVENIKDFFSLNYISSLYDFLNKQGYEDKEIEYAINIIQSVVISFCFRTELQYYENQFIKTFFLFQLIFGSKDNYLYNLSNFFKYIYADKELWSNFSVDERVFLIVESKKLDVMKILEAILGRMENKKISKFLNQLFVHIFNANEFENKFDNFYSIKSDKFYKYIIWDSKYFNCKDYLSVILDCIKINQTTLNIFVSKMILNGFVHYFLSKKHYDLNEINEFFIQESNDNEILSKLYTVLYNLNQVKLSFFDSIPYVEKNIDQFYKYEIVYGLCYRDNNFIINEYVG